jgi:sporulation protein YlmC with PRC-barrel domain/flagellar motility protein MotE (MotC chaperone)/CBS domain-containing protein
MNKFNDFHDITLHFSKAIGITIYNEDQQKLGNLHDFFIDYEEVYPSVLALQYKRSGILFYVTWDDVLSFNYKKIIIKNETFPIRSRTFPKTLKKKTVTSLLANQFMGSTVEYPPLGQIVLDKQIVDTHGKKVVRVNDIQFIRAGKDLRVTHAEIGLRSFVRRLSFEKPVDLFVKLMFPNSKYLTKDYTINWKYVHAIPNRNVQRSVRLNLTNEDLRDLHPADIADILEDLDSHGREMIFSNLDPQLAAETLSEVDEDLQASLLKNEAPEKAADIIEMMDADDAADLLNELDEAQADAIISNIDDLETQEDLQELLEHDEDTAGGLMTSEILEVTPNLQKHEVLQLIKDNHAEVASFYDIYVVDEHKNLVGTLSLQELLIQSENAFIHEIMNATDMKYLHADTHWKDVAEFMNKYNLITVPIIAKNNELLGMVSVDDVMDRLLS